MTRPHTHTTAIALCVLAATGFGRHASAQGRPPTAVRVAPVEMRDIVEKRMVTGELVAVRRSRVASRESGLVLELLVQDGQQVKRSDVIARLDTRRLELTKLELEADVAVNEATIVERTAERDEFKRDLELVRTSFERGAANPREIQDAQSAVAIAEARLLQAERQADVFAARIALIETRLADAVIRAPFDGVVINTIIENGEWIGQGDPVVELLSTGIIEAWMKVPERHLRAVQNAAEVQIEVAGRSDNVLSSSDLRILPDIDPETHSFYVVATLDNPGNALAPGMSLRSWVPTDSGGSRLLVHRDAILRNDAGPYVFVARTMGDGPPQAVPQQVRVLFPVGRFMAVDMGGLQEGDLVVIEGNERLFPMAPISPTRNDAQQAGEARR